MKNTNSPIKYQSASEVNQDNFNSDVIWVHDEFIDQWYPLDGFTVEEIEAMSSIDDIAL